MGEQYFQSEQSKFAEAPLLDSEAKAALEKLQQELADLITRLASSEITRSEEI